MCYSTEGANRIRTKCVIKEVGLIPLFAQVLPGNEMVCVLSKGKGCYS